MRNLRKLWNRPLGNHCAAVSTTGGLRIDMTGVCHELRKDS